MNRKVCLFSLALLILTVPVAASAAEIPPEILEKFKHAVPWTNLEEVWKPNQEELIGMGPAVIEVLLPRLRAEYLLEQYTLQEILRAVLREKEGTGEEEVVKEEILGYLLDHIAKEDYEGLRWPVRWAAELKIEPVRTTEVIARHAASADWRLRKAVAHALGITGTKKATPILLKLAEDEIEEVRAEAFHSMGILKDPAFLPVLVAGLGDPLFPARFNAADALVLIADGKGRERVAAEIRSLLRSSEGKYLHLAIEMAGRIDAPYFAAELDGLLNGDDPLARAFAAEAMGRDGGRGTRSLLVYRLKVEEDDFVRQTIEEVLGSSSR